MGGLRTKVRLVKSYECIDLFIDVKILNEAFSQEVIEIFQAHAEVFDVLLGDFRFPILNNNQRSHQSPAI